MADQLLVALGMTGTAYVVANALYRAGGWLHRRRERDAERAAAFDRYFRE